VQQVRYVGLYTQRGSETRINGCNRRQRQPHNRYGTWWLNSSAGDKYAKFIGWHIAPTYCNFFSNINWLMWFRFCLGHKLVGAIFFCGGRI